jgi:hypothetical protein
MVMLLALLVALCAGAAIRVVRSDASGSGKAIEVMSGIWTVLMYLGLGAAPVVFAWLR